MRLGFDRFGRSRRHESYEQARQRLIAETSAFITEGLRRPEFGVRIPVIPAASGRFPPSMTPAFWEPILFERSD